MERKSIAVIGSGISGMSAAWLLTRAHDVTLFEGAGRLGGHTNTISVDTDTGPIGIDTGFIVYNEVNYPNLTALFAHLGVETAASDMSFAVSLDKGRFEYSGAHLDGLFGQRRNILNPGHWLMVRDILRFFEKAARDARHLPPNLTISDYLTGNGYSRGFIENHILPLSAAIWSTPSRHMLDFPAKSFIAFFENHGLLKIKDRPQWRTVRSGSTRYIDRLIADAPGLSVRLDAPVREIRRYPGHVELLSSDGEWQRFDEVVIATHAPQALAMLGDADPAERALLSACRTTSNHAVLHTDRSVMPRRRNLWSSWNYLRLPDEQGDRLSVSYWMNRLQPLATDTQFFVTLNAGDAIDERHKLFECNYDHPLFDNAAIAAQSDMHIIQGHNRTWFAGAWLGHGFHEDGIQSGLAVAERLGGVTRPWTVPGANDRVAHNWAGESEHLEAAE